jgi:hypothetical protein
MVSRAAKVTIVGRETRKLGIMVYRRAVFQISGRRAHLKHQQATRCFVDQHLGKFTGRAKCRVTSRFSLSDRCSLALSVRV